MEQEPTSESEESPEQQLVRLLRERGIEDPEVRDYLDNWTREQERQVEQSDDYPLAQIEFNLRRARLYFEAGYIDAARENLGDARIQAWNEQRDELCQAIEQEIDELEDSIKNSQ